MNFSSFDHLSPEAIAAFVDNEMPPRVRHRAKIHLLHCEDCRAEVADQRHAAERMRTAANTTESAPKSLIDRLAEIPGMSEAYCEDHQQRLAQFKGAVSSVFRDVESTASKLTDIIGEHADALNRAVKQRTDHNSQRTR